MISKVLKRINLKSWLIATRPKTLVISILPVTLAFVSLRCENFFAFSLVLLCCLLIQILTNFVNDLEDFKKGSDLKRVGPLRVVTSGLITPKAIQYAILLITILTVLSGGYIVYLGGIRFLAIGLLSIFFAFAYTSGPYPLSYNGLGEPIAFIFYGPVAVLGSANFFQILDGIDVNLFLNIELIISSLFCGTGAVAFLLINNIRDFEPDKKNGKETFVVKIGIQNGKNLYILSLLLLNIIVFAYSIFVFSVWPLLIQSFIFFFSLRLIIEIRECYLEPDKVVNFLPLTGKVFFLSGISLFLSIVIVQIHAYSRLLLASSKGIFFLFF